MTTNRASRNGRRTIILLAMMGLTTLFLLTVVCWGPTRSQASLEFVIDQVAGEAWSHFDDGSFEVYHTITARVTAPHALRGRTITLQLNGLAEADQETRAGTTWSIPIPSSQIDDDQLRTLVYQRLTQIQANRPGDPQSP